MLREKMFFRGEARRLLRWHHGRSAVAGSGSDRWHSSDHSSSSMASAALRIVSINDVYQLNHLPRLRSLVRAKLAEHRARHGDGGRGGSGSSSSSSSSPFLTTLNGDFVSPSILSSMDGGRAMVEVLNRVPVDYCCFGNHEADLPLPDLVRRTREFRGKWLNSNVPDFPATLPPYDVIPVGPLRRVGLLGLLTSERGVFRNDEFRGLRIDDVVETARRWSDVLRSPRSEGGFGVDAIVALTHQGWEADEILASTGCVDVILGGHDHVVMERWHDVVVVEEDGASGSGRKVPIVKAGSDARTAAVVDVVFYGGEDEEHSGGGCLKVSVSFEDVTDYEPDADLEAVVEDRLRVVRALEREVVCTAGDFFGTTGDDDGGGGGEEPPPVLSSVGTRYRQTTVGSMLASACRDVLLVDVAAINGGSIKGDRTYEDGNVTYLDLKKELPFPTKMIAIADMPGRVLQDAVTHSRTAGGDGDPGVERRAYLQLDDGVVVDADDRHTILSVGGEAFDPSRKYSVALPRNLLKGMFDIRPLVDFAADHPGSIGEDDAFLPAINLVLSHHARQVWRRLGSFDELDANSDGVLSREEIADGIKARLGLEGEPSDVLLDTVIEAIDEDGDGFVSRSEYDQLDSAPLEPIETTKD